MDILFKNDDFIFSYRVGGILVHNGKFYYSIPKTTIILSLVGILQLWK